MAKAIIERYFKLKDAKSDNETSIRLYVFHRNFPYRRFVYGINKSILPALWDAETQHPTKDKKLIKEYEKHIPTIANDLHNVTQRINKVNELVTDYFTMAEIASNGITISSEGLKKYLDEELKRKPVELPKAKTETLNKFLERFIKELETGSRVIKKTGKRYEEGSIKNFKTFQAQLNEYQKARNIQLNFDDITIDFYTDFVNFLNKKKYRSNSIGKHIARLKVIMRVASSPAEKLHNNMAFSQGDFFTFQEPTEEVYLTEEEVNTLHDLDLNKKPHLKIYRDIFLIGCYTAQRVSDYNRINSTHIQKLGKTKVIVLNQKKTGEKVIIPIKPKLEEILKRYDYNPPRVAEQNLNDAIKDVCEMAEIKQQIEITELIGGNTVKTTKPKFEMIASHTARRTGATLMYKADIKPIDIMKITGHKKESTFLKYIRTTKEETAEALANHSYFK